VLPQCAENTPRPLEERPILESVRVWAAVFAVYTDVKGIHSPVGWISQSGSGNRHRLSGRTGDDHSSLKIGMVSRRILLSGQTVTGSLNCDFRVYAGNDRDGWTVRTSSSESHHANDQAPVIKHEGEG
jgi:hypothetical protein